jgi:hypothetical protein
MYKTLENALKASDILVRVSGFRKKVLFLGEKLLCVCTDGVPGILGCRLGIMTSVKENNSAITGTHCAIHREALSAAITMCHSLV